MISNIIENDFLEHNDFSNQLLDPIERATFESNYIQLSINSFKQIRNRNYQKAQEGYKECLNIAEQLKDNYKRMDSICNMAVALFYQGNTKEAIDHLASVHKSFSSNRYNNTLDLRQTQLCIKIICNLSIAYLSMNNPNEAVMKAKELIEYINREHQAPNQHILIKSVLYNFFRLESIVNIDESIVQSKITIENEDTSSDNQEIHKKVIKKLIYSFYVYMQKNDLNIWINSLTEEIDNLKELKDYNGLIFSIFNQQCSIYSKNQLSNRSYSSSSSPATTMTNTITTQQEQSNSNSIQGAKAKLLALTKALTGDKDFDEKNVEKILKCVKEKMEAAVQIYQMLYNKEKDILSKLGNVPNSISSSTFKNSKYQLTSQSPSSSLSSSTALSPSGSSSSIFFIKILLQYSINYINSNISDEALRNQMKSQINLTINLINNKKIDVSKLKLNEINPQIAKSINLLFINLLDIYSRCKLRKYILQYKRIVFLLKDQERIKLINDFNKRQYNSIEKGDTLIKINLTSSGENKHYYRLNFDNEAIQIFKNIDTNSHSSQITFYSIRKILFGMLSPNLRKKKSNYANRDQWLFMSFIYKGDKSLDLLFTEEQINRWFYGVHYFLNQSKRKYMILSIRGYVLSKLKMKMISELVNSSKSNRGGDLKSKYSVKSIVDDNNNSSSNTKKSSFVKVLLLYKSMNCI